MAQSDELKKPCYLARAILAGLCFVGFSITLPPLGLLFFLRYTGMLDKRQGAAFAAWTTPFQDVLMPLLILGFGLLSVFVVCAQKPIVFRSLSLVLMLLATTSLGGCVMGLSNLKDIGD